jgi:hypothetical protein
MSLGTEKMGASWPLAIAGEVAAGSEISILLGAGISVFLSRSQYSDAESKIDKKW